LKKNLEYSKSRHTFESTNKFKVMKKLILIAVLILSSGLSFGQKVANLGYYKKTQLNDSCKSVISISENSDGLPETITLNVFKDSIVVTESRVKTTYVIDSVATSNYKIRPVSTNFVTNKVNGEKFKIKYGNKRKNVTLLIVSNDGNVSHTYRGRWIK
jgi:hypothetical protein